MKLKEIETENMLSIKVVDLFCGIGGLTHGLEKEKLNVVAGYDLDSSCEFAYKANNEADFYCKDICEITGDELNNHFQETDIKILVGCAPCQPFSTYSFKSKNKKKWRLLYEFSRLIKECKPDIISMENVPRLAKFEKEPVFPDFIDELKKLGYKVDFKVVNCADYGIPQYRKRLVLLASKLGEISIVPETHPPSKHKTVQKAIGKLPFLESGQTDEKDPLHKASKLSELNMKRIKQSKPGGSWKKDWDKELWLDCHKKSTGSTYVSVYGRMSWDKPSPTITTHCNGIGNGRFGHPEQDRAISLREAAILQSFPKKYKFIQRGKPFKVKDITTQIGNAVPVKLGQVIGKSINLHLKKYYTNNSN